MAKEQKQEPEAQKGDKAAGDSVQVQEAELPEADDRGAAGGAGQIDVLLDMGMPVSAQLGQVNLQVRELLQLGPGSVLKLDKQVGEPVEMFLCGTRFAIGQLVVVGEQLGVRLEKILTPAKAQKG